MISQRPLESRRGRCSTTSPPRSHRRRDCSQQPARARIDENRYDTLEEALFALAAQTMRRWKACRNYLHAALEPTLALDEFTESSRTFHELRDQHLEQVKKLAEQYLPRGPLVPWN